MQKLLVPSRQRLSSATACVPSLANYMLRTTRRKLRFCKRRLLPIASNSWRAQGAIRARLVAPQNQQRRRTQADRVGTKLRLVRVGAVKCDKPRVVSKVQTNAIAFRTERDTESWLSLPSGTKVTNTERGFIVSSVDNVDGAVEYAFEDQL